MLTALIKALSEIAGTAAGDVLEELLAKHQAKEAPAPSIVATGPGAPAYVAPIKAPPPRIRHADVYQSSVSDVSGAPK